MIPTLLKHLGEHKAAYVIPTLVAGAMMTLGGTQWIDTRIDARVVGLESRFDTIEAKLLERELRDLQTLLCRNKGSAALQSQIDRVQREYRRLTGTRYALPSCEFLGAGG